MPSRPAPAPAPAPPPAPDGRGDRAELRADCARCFGLCCVALPFAASADFATGKDAGRPCTHLRGDFRCGIHDRLRERGFRDCTVFDCLGAGQKVSQVTFGGRDWRRDEDTARRMFAAFPVMRLLHELLWYVEDALAQDAARPLHGELRRARAEIGRLTLEGPAVLAGLDAEALRRGVNVVLLRAGDLVRAQAQGPARDHRGADLAGARLRGADLRGASLRGACLIAADLRGADLRGSVFLSPPQLAAARSDAATRRPARW